ncbi:MAG: PKD domain-containing protein, partial [candidate division Zixibacteria bacterium]|nr:PKD domain-containing protein [candidate division Zixibacteria bacterium]
SMAAPHVAGLVGLIKSLNPLLSGQEIFDRIVNSTDNIDDLNPNYVGMLGSGRINANSALTNIASTDFDANPRIGPAPLTVQFHDSSETAPTGWMWDFGDGTQSTEQHPEHTFDPGLYDVTLTIDTDIGPGQKTELRYVAALAETLAATDSIVLAGEPARIDIMVRNNLPVDTIILPVDCSNITSVGFLDSVVTTGCRTDHMSMQNVFSNKFNGEMAYRIAVDDFVDALPPGNGPIAKVYFRVRSTAQPGETIDVEFNTLGSYSLKFTTAEIAFTPEVTTGAVTVSALIGDLTGDGVHDATDLNELINVVFFNAPMPNPPSVADFNCDGVIDAVDINDIIQFIFFNGPGACE